MRAWGYLVLFLIFSLEPVFAASVHTPQPPTRARLQDKAKGISDYRRTVQVRSPRLPAHAQPGPVIATPNGAASRQTKPDFPIDGVMQQQLLSIYNE